MTDENDQAARNCPTPRNRPVHYHPSQPRSCSSRRPSSVGQASARISHTHPPCSPIPDSLDSNPHPLHSHPPPPQCSIHPTSPLRPRSRHVTAPAATVVRRATTLASAVKASVIRSRTHPTTAVTSSPPPQHPTNKTTPARVLPHHRTPPHPLARWRVSNNHRTPSPCVPPNTPLRRPASKPAENFTSRNNQTMPHPQTTHRG
jgi:hypothetical protein